MEGRDEDGKRQRRALKTRSWSQAQARLTEFEGGRVEILEPEKAPHLDAAIADYLADCRARKLEPSSIVSYTKTLGHLAAFFPGGNLASINLAALTKFRSGRIAVNREGEARSLTANTSLKEIQTMRAFFRFCAARDWIPKNPATDLKAPKSDLPPTMPFTDQEVQQILDAVDLIDNPNKREIERARLRARALVLTLLYSGLRISDAVKLARGKVNMQTG
jgi:site-specific recombinase XerD